MLAVVALVAVGCGGSSATTSGGPKTGGTLTVALDGDIQYTDPSFVSDRNSLYVADQVVEGLVGLEPGTTSTVIPVLASALPKVSADGRTYTFKLRSGIKFHDGTTLDATAVKFNYERWKSFPTGELETHATYAAAVFGGFGDPAAPGTAPIGAVDNSSNVASVDAPDPSTVVIHLRAAQSNFLLSQTAAPFGIQSPTAIEANDGNNAKLADNPYARGENGQGKAMVGTGPFMFSEWVPGDHVTLIKNPNYWNRAARPYLDQIVFKPFATSAAKLAALQSGAVDLVESLEPSTVGAVSANASLMVLDRGLACNVTQLAINDADIVNGLPNLAANQGVRFAIAAAVDKPSYVAGFYAGEAIVADNWLPAGAQYYKPEYLPTYNVAASRGFLAGAGVPTTGLDMDLWYPTGAPAAAMPDAEGLAQALARDLDAAGFKVHLKSEAYSTKYLADAAAGKLPMWIQSQSCRWAGPDEFLYSAFHYVKALPSATFGYKNDALNTVMNAALIAKSDATAKADWQKAQDLIANGMPTVPLLNSKLPAGARKDVMGFVGSGDQTEILNTVWLNK
jgi:peptide/nickel transport system substrate-binding protein